MKKIELVMLFIGLAGVLMQFLLIPGGNILFAFSFLALSLIYSFLGFALFNSIRPKNIFKKQSYEGISTLKIIGSILAGISISLLIVGIEFNILHWAGADITLIAGLICVVVLFVISLIKSSSKREKFYRTMIIRSALYTLLAIPLVLFSQYKIEKFKYRNYPDYLEAFEKYYNDPENKELKEQLYLERKRVTMSAEEYERYLEWYEKEKK